MTNFEKITKSASDLAEFIDQVRDCCYNMARYGAEACEEWLEAKEGGE